MWLSTCIASQGSLLTQHGLHQLRHPITNNSDLPLTNDPSCVKKPCVTSVPIRCFSSAPTSSLNSRDQLPAYPSAGFTFTVVSCLLIRPWTCCAHFWLCLGSDLFTDLKSLPCWPLTKPSLFNKPLWGPSFLPGVSSGGSSHLPNGWTPHLPPLP